MSIFKESFKPNIRKQLEKRQQAMLARTPQDIIYLNSHNSWVRMSSSVNVYKNTSPTPPTITDLKNEGNYDNSLAKKYILSGGTLNEDGTLKSGVGTTFESAYSRKSAEGIDYRLGIRPLPGITSIDVKSRGAYGSLRNVTVNFVCWDIHQLEDLELLYMRPGYTVLVEWGWCPYFDENDKLKSTVDFYDIVSEVKPKETIWKELEEKMAKNGNYEAMFGYVKNYSWSARPDGGYDCTTDIISLGEVIESLKVNYTPSIPIEEIKKTGILTPNLQQISSTDFDSQLSTALDVVGTILVPGVKVFNAIFGESEKEKLEKAYSQGILTGLFYELYTLAQKADPGTEDEGQGIFFKDTKYNLNYALYHKTININGEDKEDDKTVGEGDEQYYVALSSLINILNNYVLLQDGKNKTPFALLTVLDDKYYGERNNKTGDGYLLALAHPLEISIDPRVCLIKNMLWVNGININLASGNDPSKSGFTADKGRPVITFNHNFPDPDGLTDRLISLGCATNIDSNSFNDKREDIANYVKDLIQGPPNSRYSAVQIEENVKELSAKYIVKYQNKNYKVKQPNSADVTRWGLTVKNVGKTIDDIFVSDPTTFYQLLEDDYAFNFDDKLAKSIITPDGGDSDKSTEAADNDPVQAEQEKLDEQKEDLDELIEEGKEGIQFLKTLPLPYYINDDYKSELGIIGNIFINIKMLYEMSLDGNLEAQDKKEKNDIALYDFVKSILSKVQVAIGNVNNFDIFVENNLAKIIDINYVDPRNPKDVYDEAFQLEMHNLKSTVRSYKLESKIFQEQGSIVAVGAQVGGGALGTDTTSLVAFNRSIWDRIIPIKDAPTDSLTSNEGKAKAEALLGNLKTLYKFFARLDSGLFTDSDFDVDKASGYSNALKDLITYMRNVTSSKTSNRAILPTVLSVEMDGIGGIIIGTIFKTPLDMLPKGYKGVGNGGTGSNLGYIVTGLGHSVGNGDWVTKIDAQTIILDPPLSDAGEFDFTDITIDINPTTSADTSVVKETRKITPTKIPPPPLIKAMKDYGIVDPIERAHFLAQCSHESGGFAWTKEFASGEAYEGRRDLGNTQPGDGKRFKGRGYIQITGRANYTKYNQYLKSKGINDDIILNPQLLETKFAADSACYWWKFLSRDITKLAKAGTTPNDVVKVTKRVNGGTNGLADRQSRFDGYWTTLQKNPNSYT